MRIPAITFLLLAVVACKDNKPAAVKKEKAKVLSAAVRNPEVKWGVEGFYTGSFEAVEFDENKIFRDVNRITICIDSLNEKTVYGHSIVAGNERPFSGSYSKEGDTFTATVKEPGDNKYDGVFTLTINSDKKEMEGHWVANDKTLPVTARKYVLKPKLYQYDPSLALPEDLTQGFIVNTYNEKTDKGERLTQDILTINASQKLLTSADVENLYKADLEVIRNAIYARHGYSFKNIRMRDLFDNYVDWYMPVTTNVSGVLTETELKNIELIKRYEKHADKYYDSFGR